MRRKRGKTSVISLIVWMMVILYSVGIGGIFDRIGDSRSEVEYDDHMRTDSYRVDIDVGEDNSYHIYETITVDMLERRHGIYRYIPIKGYIQDQQGKRTPYYASAELLACSAPVSTETDGGFFVMRLGDEDSTVYGKQTYKLEYTLTPKFQEKGITCAYYNLFPLNWQNEIPEGSRFNIRFPKSFDHDKLELYYGAYGESKSAMDILDVEWQDNILSGTLKQSLNLGSGITMYADLGEGYFTKENLIARYDLVLIVIGAAVLLVTVILFFLFGRDREIIPSVQFQPPVDLDSAAVGYIIDGSVENKDIISLILYWADRGHLTIEETDKKNLILHKTELPLPDDAPKYEKTFFERLFKRGDSVKVKSLKYKCAETIETAKSQVKDFVKVRGGLYTTASQVSQVVCVILTIVPMTAFTVAVTVLSDISTGGILLYLLSLIFVIAGIFVFCYIVDKWHARTRAGRNGTAAVGIGLVMIGIAGIASSYYQQISENKVFDFIVPLAVCGVATVICVYLSAFMKKRTAVCAEWMGRLIGLREFIETAELDRMKAMAEENPQWFYHVLPYTYVFGLSDVFAKRLEELAIPAPEWYVGCEPHYGYWNYYHFNRMMMRNMDTISNTLTMVKTPEISGGSSGGGFSGGSSGGGFSGGGFGGGGGGSW